MELVYHIDLYTQDRYLEAAISLMNLINKEVYIVGGFVRDSILSQPCKDVDIVTSLPLKELSKLLREYNIPSKCVGAKFQVLTVKYKGFVFDIAKTRVDIGSTDNRHPDEVRTIGVSFQEDALRRDFTFNTLLLDVNGDVYEVVPGAFYDLTNKILRPVGDPYARFEEDYLRVLRAIKFMSKYGFTPTLETLQALHDISDKVYSSIASERIWSELVAIFQGNYLVQALSQLDCNRALNLLGNKLYESSLTPYQNSTLFQYTLEVLMDVQSSKLEVDKFSMNYVTMFHAIGVLYLDRPITNDFLITHTDHAYLGAKSVKDFLTQFNLKEKYIEGLSSVIKYSNFCLYFEGTPLHKKQLINISDYFSQQNLLRLWTSLMKCSTVLNSSIEFTPNLESRVKNISRCKQVLDLIAQHNSIKDLNLSALGVDLSMLDTYNIKKSFRKELIYLTQELIYQQKLDPTPEAIYQYWQSGFN